MELKLNKEQYKKLLELVYLGNWMVNAYRTDDYLEEYSDVVSNIFSQAEAAGLEGKAVKDETRASTCLPMSSKRACRISSAITTASASGKS